MTEKIEIKRVVRSKQTARTVYDRISGWYDWLASNSEQPLAELGLELLDAQLGERVLEIGCGTGQALPALASAVGYTGEVIGIDLSRGMLQVARKRIADAGFSRRAAFGQADAARLPFESSSFDNIFMCFVLELFDTPEIPVVLAECRRVLRPGGRICVVAMVRDEPGNMPVRIYEWFHDVLPALVDCRPIFAQAALAEAGFKSGFVIRKMLRGMPVEICLALQPEQ